MTDPRATRPVDLQADGLLWLINREVFHPRGYALGYDPEERTFVLMGDGTEPFVYPGDGSAERVDLARIKELLK